MINLCIFDASCLVYAGHCGSSYSSHYDTVKFTSDFEGLPIGGVRFAIRRIFEKLLEGYSVVVVFDSHTDKTKYFANYKSTRRYNPAIDVQRKILYDFIRASNIPTLKVDGYEADDLIAAFVNLYAKDISMCDIISGDRDLAANVLDKRIRVVGATSSSPTITIDNFSVVVHNGAYVPYNTILPYFSFFGKSSNNVPSFSSREINNQLYQSFLAFAKASDIEPGYHSQSWFYCRWLMKLLSDKDFDEGLISQLHTRMNYVFPKSIKLEKNIKFIGKSDLNIKAVAPIMAALNLDTQLTMFDSSFSIGCDKGKYVHEFLAPYVSDYKSGALAVSAGYSADDSYYFGQDSDLSTAQRTSSFMDGDEF